MVKEEEKDIRKKRKKRKERKEKRRCELEGVRAYKACIMAGVSMWAAIGSSDLQVRNSQHRQQPNIHGNRQWGGRPGA